MAKFKTYYDNLQIARFASDAVIKAAYRGLSQRYHPDKNLGNRQEAERVMTIINEAYEILSDPAKRLEHDKWIRQMEAVQANAQPVTSQHKRSDAATANVYDFVVYPSRKRMFWMFVGSGIFVVIGIALLQDQNETSWLKDAMRFVTIYLGTPFFGLCGIYYFARLANPSPSIVVNEHGIQILTPGGATLRWSEIADIRIEKYQNKRYLIFVPTNPNIVMQRQSLWGRLGTKFSSYWISGAPSIVVAEALIGMPIEDLIAQLEARMHAPRTCLNP